jgi:hypothetical protein
MVFSFRFSIVMVDFPFAYLLGWSNSVFNDHHDPN